MRRTLPFLVLLAGAAWPAPAEDAVSPALGAIESIQLDTGDVFTEAEAARAWFPYKLANGVHATTRRKFVERALLFAVGDPLDGRVLEETERNLRATGLFRFVSVRAEGSRVVVETRDAWTLIPTISVSDKAGLVTYTLGISDANLLGTGQRLVARYDNGTVRISRSLTYDDRQFLFRPYLALHVAASDLSDGKAFEIGLARPFYALTTESAAGLAYRYADFQEKQWGGGVETATWEMRQRRLRAEAGLRVSGAELTEGGRANRLSTFVEYDYQLLLPGPYGPPPPAAGPREFLWTGLVWERAAQDFIKRRQIQRIDRDEDFNLARTFRLELGFSPSSGELDGAARLAVSASKGLRRASGFGIATLSAETRWADGPSAGRYGLDLRWWFVDASWTLALHLGGTLLHRPDPEVQLETDGENGLRGYRLHAVAGTRRLVANAEARTVFLSDVLSLVSIGAAAFVDGGWSGGPPDGMVALLDAGVGLRFGLARSSAGTILRLDVSRALLEDPLGRRGWLVTFASSQAF